MAYHAGFAVALTLREQFINKMLLAAYANRQFRRWLGTSELPDNALPGGPHAVSLGLFLAPPRVDCLDGDLRLSLHMWGWLSITIDEVIESRDIEARLDLTFPPHFYVAGSSLELVPGSGEARVTKWDFEALSGDYSPAADDHLRSIEFRDRLQSAIRLMLVAGLLQLPKIPLRFFSSLPITFETSAKSRSLSGAVLIGLNLENTPFEGNVELLTDFAHGNDFAGVLNLEALRLILIELTKPQLADEGATLHELSVTGGAGRLRVAGEASKHGFSAAFSFALAPVAGASKPGKIFQYAGRPVSVRNRTWPAFGLQIVDPDVAVPSLLVSILTLGLANLVAFVLDVAGEAEQAIAGSDVPATIPRVQRVKPRLGQVTTRIEIAETELGAGGIYIGVRTELEVPTPRLLGTASIPADFRTEKLRYVVVLPIGVLAGDRNLRVRWTITDPANGSTLLVQDRGGLGSDGVSFAPREIGPAVNRMRIGVRVYRTLGAQITDLVNDSMILDIRGPLAPGAYVRWYYDVKNPQVQYDRNQNGWDYAGERTVKRHSRLHRTDQPCAMQSRRSRYTYQTVLYDDLPFPISALPEHRTLLCDYCFYGGPAGVHLSL